jgi:hemerythrin-like domain-containing protein
MLRDKNLVPLSHQHQRALALCVRLDRALQAGAVDPAPWQEEIEQAFEQEIRIHFAAEEAEVFPAALRFEELNPLVEELQAEHIALRALFAEAASRSLGIAELQVFVERLATHIRREERQLFERLQGLMSAAEMSVLGARLEQALAEASQACILPSEATRLRPKS